MVIKAVLVLPTDQVGSLLIKPDVATAVFIIHAVFLNLLAVFGLLGGSCYSYWVFFS